jgi:hypothetical protein
MWHAIVVQRTRLHPIHCICPAVCDTRKYGPNIKNPVILFQLLPAWRIILRFQAIYSTIWRSNLRATCAFQNALFSQIFSLSIPIISIFSLGRALCDEMRVVAAAEVPTLSFRGSNRNRLLHKMATKMAGRICEMVQFFHSRRTSCAKSPSYYVCLFVACRHCGINMIVLTMH